MTDRGLTPEESREYRYWYYHGLKDKWLPYHLNWQREHRSEISARQTLRYQSDVSFRIKRNLYRRVIHALRGHIKSKRTMALIGCTIEFFKEYIQSQFSEGMTWENYGKWEIDHITPCSKFDLSNENDQIKCFNYSNMRPMWLSDNRKSKQKSCPFINHLFCENA